MNDLELKPYKEIGGFRFWCQKVLPLVYDDSLSYYELLCKLYSQINDLIKNYNGLQENFSALVDAYNELKEFVLHYFDTLDVQDEINKKLDSMAEEGVLDSLFYDIFKPFYTKRVLSFLDGYGSNFIAFTGSSYLLINDGPSSNIAVTEISTSGTVLGVSFIAVNAHPNGGWYKDGKIYIVASNTRNIYMVNYITKEVEQTFTCDKGEYLVSGYFDGTKAYISVSEGGGQGIYLFEDGGYTKIGVCRYALNTHPVSTVPQSFFVFGKYIYLIFNRPNAFLKYSYADCSFVGVVELGEGDGIYPYGELESAVFIGGDVYILSDLYNINSAASNFVSQLFLTNLNSDFTPNSYFGDGMPKHDVLIVNVNSTALNPDGSSSKPFKSILEACYFYQYHYALSKRFMGIKVEAGTYTDGFKLNNCTCEITGEFPVIPYIDLYNVSGIIRAFEFTSEICELRNCNLKLMSVRGSATFTLSYSTLYLYYVSCKLKAANCFIGGYRFTLESSSNTFPLGSLVETHKINFNKNTSGTVELNPLIQNLFGQSVPLVIDAILIVADPNRSNDLSGNTASVYLREDDCASINSGSSVTRYSNLLMNYNGFNIVMSVKWVITKTSIVFQTDSGYIIDLSSKDANPTIYLGDIRFTF